MANQYLTVQQAQYLLEKWKSDADATYLKSSGYLIRTGANMGFENQLTDVSSQIGHAPSESKYTAFILRDMDLSNTWYIQNVIFNDGILRTDYITTRLDANGNRLMNGFYQIIRADGTLGIAFTNENTRIAWVEGLKVATETVSMGNPTITSGVGATVASNPSCKTGKQVSISLRLTGAKLSAGTASICTIPSGFRPAAEAFCVILVAGVYRNGSISTSGVVNVYSGVAVTGAEIKLLSTYRTS